MAGYMKALGPNGGIIGRPPGSKSKAPMIMEELDRLGFKWIEEAVARFRDPTTPNSSKDFCLGLIVDRVAPKIKAIEVTNKDANSHQVLIQIHGGTINADGTPEISVEQQRKLVGDALSQALDEAPEYEE